MANPQKNKEICAALCKELDKIANGERSSELESSVNKAFHSFLNGHKAERTSVSDYGSNMLNRMQHYCGLLAKRQKVDIAGGEREIATEEDALSALKDAYHLAKNILVPYFKNKNDFSNRIFNDIYNLGLSYVESITNGVAFEYIDAEDAFDAKMNAIRVAKEGIRVGKMYRESDCINEGIENALVRFGSFLGQTKPAFTRSFEVVSTTQKKIIRKEENLEQLIKRIVGFDKFEKEGQFEYKPAAIFPIAHGGTEFGVLLSNAYEDRGFIPITYPLQFSMKTRKQKEPWTDNDNILKRSLEGKNVIITEDWITTGNTARGIIQKVENCYPKEIRIATIKRDPRSSDIPFLKNYHVYIGEWKSYPGPKADSLSDMKP